MRMANVWKECENPTCQWCATVTDEHEKADYETKPNVVDNGVYGLTILFYDRRKNVCEAVHSPYDKQWEVRELTGATRRMLYWPGGFING